MKTKLQLMAMIAIIVMPFFSNAQAVAPVLGEAGKFVIFSTNGYVTDTGMSRLTGNVGTNTGDNTGFGNVDGQMHDTDLVTAQAAADLLIAYNQLDAAIPQYFPAPLLGNDQVLTPGVYAIEGAAIMDGILTLNGQNDPDAVFIIQIDGAFSTTANSEVILTNGVQACNVFWKIEGLVAMAAGTTMRGTVIANNGAITMNTNTFLEGRAMSTTGAITLDGVESAMPIGCNSVELTGPVAPTMGGAICFTLFAGTGAVANTGTTFVTGDVGSNGGAVTGFQTENVTGNVYTQPNTQTGVAATDLGTMYTYMNLLPHDIELLYPAQFGNNLVLTPHTYLLNAATVLTGTVYLNAQDNEDAVFVLKVNGAFSTGSNAQIVLINGAQAKNVYWKIDGATNAGTYSILKGTFLANTGAVDLMTGVTLDGRAFSVTGEINTNAVTAVQTVGCPNLSVGTVEKVNVGVYPNPFSTVLNFEISNDVELVNADVIIVDMLGRTVVKSKLENRQSTVYTGSLPSGIYIYSISSNGNVVQTGKVVSK